MLTSLLPGLRHFRTPFAVGALLAFQIWLAIGGEIPSPGEAHGVLRRVYSLGELAGKPIVTAVVAFALYLLGDILKLTTGQAVFIGALFRRSIFMPVTPGEFKQLARFSMTALQERGLHDDVETVSVLARAIMGEFPEVRMRLTASHADVYLENDRLDSEAEFRFNMALFSASLWIVSAVTWSPWFLFGLIASAILYDNGLRALRDANAILVQAIVSGIVTSRIYELELQMDEASEHASRAVPDADNDTAQTP
ncbi:hypothetical protein [Streptomyces sp. NRRL S-455]|uniref:hypothetical protein n=1 Tax=Streptomyces sp. NRRL S-455 TaxID=1463908 RepID=UPI00131A4C4C|nr:hypothetical protein [Streptomyces sp. NRRL S-455]